MKKAIVAIVVVAAVAVALGIVFLGASEPPSAVNDVHKAAAIQVARCDAAMSQLDAALGSANPANAIATRIEACTKAKSLVERARANKPSTQLDVAYQRVIQHLARLDAVGSGSGPSPGTGSSAGSAGSSS
jgi:hypothetical protein